MTDMTQRQTDTTLVERIETLIESEPDALKRTQLLVQLQIANLLIDNISSVRVIADEFKHHRSDYEKHVNDQNAIVNRSWGAWKAFAVLYVAVQAVLGWVFVDTVTDYREVKKLVREHTERIVILEQKRP